MPIETDFSFKHAHMGPPPGSTLAFDAAAPAQDLLGPLRGLVGHAATGKALRTWRGTGYNMIWRPNNGKQSGPNDFFLEMFKTRDTISFRDITGSTGVANRGFRQADIFLGSLAYQQSIDTQVDGSGQHFEVGVWINVPATEDPAEQATVTRMGSIPHGTTVNLQGQGKSSPLPLTFPKASIVPFVIGQPSNQITTGAIGDAMKLQVTSPSRSPLSDIPEVTQEMFSNPNLFLSQANAHRTIKSATVLQIQSSTAAGAEPDVGGGVDSIAFLVGKSPDGPNADVSTVSATFWIERLTNPAGGPDLLQLQYSQTVLLNFNGLSWPHVTVGTLTPHP